LLFIDANPAMPLACHVLVLPADGDGLDLLGYVEFQRNYR
jgi:hypothetical protein